MYTSNLSHLGTVGLQLGHNTGVVALIASHQVATLQHQTHHRGIWGELDVLAGVIPGFYNIQDVKRVVSSCARGGSCGLGSPERSRAIIWLQCDVSIIWH